MASVLGRFMEGYARQPAMPRSDAPRKEAPPQGPAKPIFHPKNPMDNTVSVNVKTLGDRRKAMKVACELIAAMCDAETDCIDNTPANLQNGARFEMAEERLERLTEALDALNSIYDQ